MNITRQCSLWTVLLGLALICTATPALAQDTPPVEISFNVSGGMTPGAQVTVRADVVTNDGSTVQGFAWSQEFGFPLNLGTADRRNLVLRLPQRNQLRGQLVHTLAEPPVTADQLPPNVPLPDGEFPAGIQNRWQVLGINPFSLEEAGLIKLAVAVTTTSGTYHAEVELHIALPWSVAGGISNVPIDVPVVLYGKEQEGYNWQLQTPMGSRARLAGAGSQSPEFTPDIPGVYTVRVRDNEAGGNAELVIYAGTWRGVIIGQDMDGRPVPEGLCTACHRDMFAPDLFTPWAQTGHAEIFTDLLDTNTHYSTACFSCHTVGYNPNADNGGVDEAADFQAFLGAGLLNNPGDNWTTVLDDFPETAQMANIQCENCHGPQESGAREDTLAHGWRADVTTEPRVDLSSNVCAVCHGEPLRHARFQQWQLSPHANYELAIDEGGSGSCSRCHTANGFLAWLPILLGDEPGDPLDDVEVTWTSEETHPQTCQTCHDPHAIGTTSGSDPNATVRISGSTPNLIAGFRAIGVGKGAICITCHNSRRGLRNDDTFADILAEGDGGRAPHGGVQGDVLMGENAFGTNVGVRGPHSFVEDTCVACHMEATPPPAVLSYNQGGTNHTFRASPDICSECHDEVVTAEVLQGIVEEVLVDVETELEKAWMRELTKIINAGNDINLGGGNVVSNAGDLRGITMSESRGQQALIVRLPGGVEVGPVRLSGITVVQPAPLPNVDVTQVANPNLLKAGWNFFLIHADGSLGVHNPTYTLSVLDAARDMVSPGTGGPRTRLPF